MTKEDYIKLGTVVKKAINGFGVFELKGKELQLDKPCSVGDIVVRLKKDGERSKVFAIAKKDWDKLESSKQTASKTTKPKTEPDSAEKTDSVKDSEPSLLNEENENEK